jgi:hypothetical protein
MNYLRDPLWQFIGAVVAVAALALSILVALAQRRRKRLGYHIETATAVLSMREELAGRIKVLLDDELVDDLRLYILRFTNVGNVPIRSGDYERPITITFGKSSQVVSAEVTEQHPQSLAATITCEPVAITIKPLLLNEADSLAVKCLVTRSAGVTVDARIVGVSRIEPFAVALSPVRLFWAVVGILIFIGALVVDIIIPNAGSGTNRHEVVCITVGMIGTIVAAISFPYRAVSRLFRMMDLSMRDERRRGLHPRE